MPVVPAIREVIGVLTDNWHRASPAGWQLTFDAVSARGGRLADVIRDRYLTLRDDVARQSYDERRGVWDVAWERAQEMARERGAQVEIATLTKLTPTIHMKSLTTGRGICDVSEGASQEHDT